jgi:hypothetical protein
MDMTHTSKEWNKKEVVRIIKALAAKGEKLNSDSVARSHSGLAYAGRRYWGSWDRALKAAGLDCDKIRRKTHWSRARIVGQIRDIKKAGGPLSYTAAEADYHELVPAATTLFGSWRKAIEAAGLDYTKIKRHKQWSKSEVAREIKRMNKAGLDLSTTIPVRAKCRSLHASALRYFGSWAAAMKAAGLGKLYRSPFQS